MKQCGDATVTAEPDGETQSLTPLLRWWVLFATVYGACLLVAARRHDAGMLALVGLGATVPPVGLLAAIDVVTRQLPRVISYSTFVVVLPLLLLDPNSAGDGRWSAVFGAGLMLAITAAVRFAGRGSLGRGDLHFSPLLGAVAGWFGARLVISAWLAAAILGGFAAMLLLIFGRDRRTRFAYGPFLLLGLCVALVMVGR